MVSYQSDASEGAASAPAETATRWLLVIAIVACLVALFHDGILHVIQQWEREEFSYGYVVPPITAWLVWQRLDELKADRVRGSWLGLLVIAAAILVTFPARIGGMPTAIYYAFVVALFGLSLTLVGWAGTRRLAVPLIYLFFALPLPSTLYVKVSTAMQFISSELGVEVLRWLGVSVFLEGNIIDLGLYKLQVAEACNGLRYLFPLSSFAFIVAYLYRGPFWHKALLFVSTAPITIVINSIRIAVTGVLVNAMGIAAAEGFLHWFEGWAIFLAGLLLFYLEVWLLLRLTGRRGGVWSYVRFEMLWPIRSAPGWPTRFRPARSATVAVLLAAGLVSAYAVPERDRVALDREPLVTFPLILEDWRGQDQPIEQRYLDILKVDDYLLADYTGPDVQAPVNLYIAYYESQDQNASIHSPSVCIPAGGWEITTFDDHMVDGIAGNAQSLKVNRSVIVNSLERQLVYYWFDLRGRQLTNEFMIKMTNVWDGLTEGRTDGALIRLTTPIRPGEPVGAADERLQAFLADFYPRFRTYVPG